MRPSALSTRAARTTSVATAVLSVLTRRRSPAGEERGDQGVHLVGPLELRVVPAPLDDHEARPRHELAQVLSGHRGHDAVVRSPDEKRGDVDAAPLLFARGHGAPPL